MSKNVAVFVDVANVFYAAKAAGVEIDYVTLLKAASAGRDFIRAYAYTGLDPENENQRQFQNFLARNGYKVVSKDIRKYGDGKVKANLDIELVVDMMKTARNVDIAVLVSGDGDFAPAIRAVQEMGVRVEVISFRGNTSSDLIEAADQFTDITELAKVERTGRSGRRVSAAEGDLSMTAVPDKETDGAPRRRRRTTKAAAEAPAAAEEGPAQPAAATAGGRRRPAARRAAAEPREVERGAPVVAARSAAEAIAAAGVAGLRVLPGERLSRAAEVPAGAEIPVGAEASSGPSDEPASPAAALEGLEATEAIEATEATEEPTAGAPPAAPVTDAAAGSATGPAQDGEGRRRRRRRGGRGRGRGRGREREVREGAVAAEGEETFDGGGEAETILPAPRAPQSTFGSIWDSQLGMSAPPLPATDLPEPGPDEDGLEEPEIHEYLLAERRRGGQARPGGRGGRPPRGGRGARGAYAAALDRERYGRSGSPSSWSPDRRGRPAPRPAAPPGAGAAPAFQRGPSAEPWSEVPPDLEEQIRAQLATGRQAAPAAASESVGKPDLDETATAPARVTAEPPVSGAEGATATGRRTASGRRRGTRTMSAAPAPAEAPPSVEGPAIEAAAAATPPRRTRPRAAPKATSEAGAAASSEAETGAEAAAETAASDGAGEAATPKRRTRRTSSKTTAS